MATSLDARRIGYQIAGLRCDDIAYYESQIKAWSRTDDAKSRRNVAEFTRRLERAKGRLARLKALLEVKRD